MYWSFLSCLKMIWQLWFILLFVFVTTVFYFLLLSPQSQTSGSSFSPRFQEDTKLIHPTFYPDTKHCAAEDSVWVMVTELGLVWSVSPSYPQVLRHVQELLSQTVEGGQQQTHALICSETSLTHKHREGNTREGTEKTKVWSSMLCSRKYYLKSTYSAVLGGPTQMLLVQTEFQMVTSLTLLMILSGYDCEVLRFIIRRNTFVSL